jgi:hypothetical protein
MLDENTNIDDPSESLKPQGMGKLPNALHR